MKQVKTPQRDWTPIDEACLMSCRHRDDVDLAEYDMWLVAKNRRDLQGVKILIGVMCVPFVLLAIMCAWSLHTGDWSWLD